MEDEYRALEKEMGAMHLEIALLKQDFERQTEDLKNLKSGISRGLWILGGGFIAGLGSWVMSGGLFDK